MVSLILPLGSTAVARFFRLHRAPEPIAGALAVPLRSGIETTGTGCQMLPDQTGIFFFASWAPSIVHPTAPVGAVLCPCRGSLRRCSIGCRMPQMLVCLRGASAPLGRGSATLSLTWRRGYNQILNRARTGPHHSHFCGAHRYQKLVRFGGRGDLSPSFSLTRGSHVDARKGCS
jgi:hypothetical protein